LVGISAAEVLHRPEEGGAQSRGLSPANARRLTRAAEAAIRWSLGRSSIARAGRLLFRRMPDWVGPLTSLFVEDGEKAFRDRWHLALPMDNQLDDRLWPTLFSELWVPLERAGEVMRAIREAVHAGEDRAERHRRVRAFPIELYPGPKSRFWLSPGYGRAGLRVNPARFAQWTGEPHQGVLALFHQLLEPFDPRPHWGKLLPGASEAWLGRYLSQLPRLGDFLRLRGELDPGAVFATDYWRRHLGIG
jgi:hypothetical protein